MAYKLTAKTPYGTWTDVSMHPKQFIVLAAQGEADWYWEVMRETRRIEHSATLLRIEQELKGKGLSREARGALLKDVAETRERIKGLDALFDKNILQARAKRLMGKAGSGTTFFLDLKAALDHASKLLKAGAADVEIFPVTSRRKVPDKQAVRRSLGITFTT